MSMWRIIGSKKDTFHKDRTEKQFIATVTRNNKQNIESTYEFIALDRLVAERKIITNCKNARKVSDLNTSNTFLLFFFSSFFSLYSVPLSRCFFSPIKKQKSCVTRKETTD